MPFCGPFLALFIHFLQSSVEKLGELFEELATLSNEGDDEDGEDLNELDGIGE